MLQAFPDMHVRNDYPLQFGEGDWTTVMGKVSGDVHGQYDFAATHPEGLLS
jgi:hypothetical protein